MKICKHLAAIMPTILIPLGVCASPSVSLMNKLLEESRLFELTDQFAKCCDELQPTDRLYFSAHIDNAMGRYSESNTAVEQLVILHASELTKERMVQILSVKSDNYAKQNNYRAAAQILNEIIQNYSSQLSRAEREDMNNMLTMWHSLRDVAPQTVDIENISQLTIPIRYNDYNHWLLRVSSTSDQHDLLSMEFVFDSGANISVMSTSTAERFEVVRTESSVSVGNSVGSEVRSSLGYVPVIYIGGIKIENMIVLILPDEALSIGDYKIDGIIGFPVIQSLGEFSISRDGVFSVSSPMLRPIVCGGQQSDKSTGEQESKICENAERNILTLGFTPFVRLTINDRFGSFVFDTGARTSHITKKYFRANRKYFEATGSQKLKIGGAGEIKEVKKRSAKNCRLEVAGKLFQLPMVDILFHDGLKIAQYDGFLGQDVLLQSQRVIINLRDMYLRFE